MAEEHASTLLRQKAIEDKKMRELEKIRETLEVCLEEEKQAKKDEEIVRQLQGLFWILDYRVMMAIFFWYKNLIIGFFMLL